MTEALAQLGGLGGVAALVTSLGTLWGIIRVKRDTDQLRPNHGSSLRDVVDRIAHQVDSLDTRMTDLDRQSTDEHARLWKAIHRR